MPDAQPTTAPTTSAAPPQAPVAEPPKAGQPPAAPASAEGAQAALEAATGEAAPEQKKGETDAQYELRLSKLTREAQRARAEAEQHKTARQKSEEEAALLKAELEKAKNKRMTVREYRELTKKLLENPQARGELLEDDDLPPALREMKERMEAQLKEAEEKKRADEQAKQTEAQKAQHQREIGIVAEALKADSLPLFAGNERAAEHVLEVWYSRWREMGMQPERKPSLESVASEVHEALARNLTRALQSEQSRTFLAQLVPELKGLLGGAEANAGSPTSGEQGAGGANGRAAAPVPADPSKLTDAERKALQLKALAEAKEEWKRRKAG